VKTTLACMIVLVCLACSGSSPDLAGRYQADYSGLSGPVTVVMVLGEDGSGKWEIFGEELLFSWVASDGGLRVHTREGAVVEGLARDGELHLDVPGVGELRFRRL